MSYLLNNVYFCGNLFKFRLFFVLLQKHLPNVAGMSYEKDGADGRSTTY